MVKPSGPMWHSSVGITYHQIDDFSEILDACINLLNQLEAGDSVLVEPFYETIKPIHSILLGKRNANRKSTYAIWKEIKCPCSPELPVIDLSSCTFYIPLACYLKRCTKRHG